MEQYKLINRIMAVITFAVTLLTFAMTLQPSVPFWDCGEFTTAATWQQVPHPPGAPLWLMAARLFQLIPIGDAGWRVNMVSAVCGAFASLLVYLTTVKMIERWRPFNAEKSALSYLPTFGGALIAALAFTWCDTNWFNSVESEVYAGGTLLTAFPIYLAMLWDQKAEQPGHERYLLLIAYLLGLSMGVHLLALLTVPTVAMIIYYRYSARPNIITFSLLTAVTGVAFYILYEAPLRWIPQLLAKNMTVGLLILLGLMGLVVWCVQQKWHVAALAVSGFLLIFLGFTTYTHVLVRANAKPPMNENDPDTFTELVSYLGREQYGNNRPWPRRYQPDEYYQQRLRKYGDWYPPVGQDEKGYIFDQVNTAGEVNYLFKYQIYHMYIRYFLWNFVGRVSDIQDAQWALAGVDQNTQRDFVTPVGNDAYPVRFFALPLILGLIGLYYHFRRDWKTAFSMLVMFTLMGVIATLQQNQQEPQPRERDYFYVGSFMVFCIWIGIGATGLAEDFAAKKRNVPAVEGAGGPEPEPVLLPTDDGLNTKAAAILAACFLAVPFNMAFNGWRVHDRSGNWVPWDYSYNILQSCEKDAILFTNGDNDTFPVWYLQDVAGVRRDVRVVNLSLGQTLWYIYQLKNETPWGAKKVPISFPDEELLKDERESSIQASPVDKPEVVTVAVPAQTMQWATGTAKDTVMSWTLDGNPYGNRTVYTVYHKLIKDIMLNNKWQRPVYFSATVGPDAWAGLQQYFRWEGMAWRVMPVRQQTNDSKRDPRTPEQVNVEIMRKCLMETLPDDKFETGPHYGMKFRNLSNPSVFFMEDHRRLMTNSYRLMYITLAQCYLSTTNMKEVVAVLDKMEAMISPEMFPMPAQLLAQIAKMYRQAGDGKKADKYSQMAETAVDVESTGVDQNDPIAVAQAQAQTIQMKAELAVARNDYDKAAALYQTLRQQYPQDPDVRNNLEDIQVRKYLDKGDKKNAIAELRRILQGYEGEKNPAMLQNANAFRKILSELGVNADAGDSAATAHSPKSTGAQTQGGQPAKADTGAHK